MEKDVVVVPNHCFICGQLMSGKRKSALETTSHSEKAIFKYIETFIGCKFEEKLFSCREDSHAEICESCFEALEEYDLICSRAAKIQEEIFENFTKNQENIHKSPSDQLSKTCSTQFSEEDEFDRQECQDDETLNIIEFEYIVPSDDDQESRKYANSRKGFKYTCNQCQEQFSKKFEYKAHVRVAHQPEDATIFTCSECPSSNAFTSEMDLKLHRNLNHPTDIHVFGCPACSKSFTSKSLLNRHFGIHTAESERPHVCEICGKTFYHRSSFLEHIKMHFDQRNYTCSICEKSFRSISHLNRHRKIHTKQKDFECETCGNRFAERYNLRAHMRTHLGISTRKKKQSNF